MFLQKPNLEKAAKEFKEKLSKIKVCAFDVDGILTNGLIHWEGEEVGWNRSSHVRDGYGLKLLKQAGYKVGVITGGHSVSIVKRYQENLKLDFCFSGNEDKRDAFNSLLNEGHEAEEILYMGDEMFDIPLLKRAGFSATVPNSSPEVQDSVDYVTETFSGQGAAREVIDILRLSTGFQVDIREFNE